ncbi:MAG TPA: FAD-dependent oxidoreductase, partial [Paraburkholderia sp.]|nr:FAD-dependent oxidoreductase [Paraburkholderia sp.]
LTDVPTPYTDALLGLARLHASTLGLYPRQTHAIAYAKSPLNWIAAVASGTFSKGPAPGTVLPECRLQRFCEGAAVDIHLTDLLGPCFTALRFGADVAQDEAWQQLHHALGEHSIPFKAVTLITGDAPRPASTHVVDPAGRLHEMLDAKPGTVYLIRPDGHVLARWRNGNAANVQSAVTASLTN